MIGGLGYLLGWWGSHTGVGGSGSAPESTTPPSDTSVHLVIRLDGVTVFEGSAHRLPDVGELVQVGPEEFARIAEVKSDGPRRALVTLEWGGAE